MINLKDVAKLNAMKVITQMILDNIVTVEGLGTVLDRFDKEMVLARISESIDSISESCTNNLEGK